jgi:hypothetical protein
MMETNWSVWNGTEKCFAIALSVLAAVALPMMVCGVFL